MTGHPEREGPGGAAAAALSPGDLPSAAEDGDGVPPRALGVSVLALVAAGVAGLLWPEAAETYSGLVWLLALVPVFLLSYYRGWWGAAVAALLSMVALTGVEVFAVGLLGQEVSWTTYAFATVILVAVTLGSGLLSELLHQRKELAVRMAYEDPLTGLANRRLIERDGERALARARREETTPAVLFFDLIRFKRINDELGFGAGDDALTVVGRRVRNAVRETDTVARVGGDEFAALLPACGGRGEARQVAERIRSALWRPIKVAGQPVHLGARVGMSIFPEDGTEFDDLLTAASPAKRGGGEGWKVLLREEDEAEEAAGDLSMESELVAALESDDQLGVHYQPVARVEDDAVVGVEALLRWHHPERGVLDAGTFVPSAERMGIIGELERELLAEAVAQAARWADRGVPIWTSVNLSLTSLEGAEGRETLTRLADEHGLPPDRLVVEVTERITARNPASARRHLEALRDRGFLVAIDDFGTGHSSLAYFEQFPLDLVKVDRMFAGDLADRGRKQRLVEGILGLAHGLDLSVVAEGVEEDEQLAWLSEAGCDLYQGHRLARPRPAAEVEAMLREGRLAAVEEAASGGSAR